MDIIYSPVSFISSMGADGVKEGGGFDILSSSTSFTLLENMIIWCKIQVIIKPLMIFAPSMAPNPINIRLLKLVMRHNEKSCIIKYKI